MISPVVSVDDLSAIPDAVLVDARHYLDGRSAEAAYREGHIPGAVFVSMDDVLANPPSPAAGRHPLPAPERFAAGMAAAGISLDSTVVAYDDAGGAMAARIVWMLRLLGVDAALLDGGLAAWSGPLTTDVPTPTEGHFPAQPWPEDALATIDDLGGAVVIDARAPERYRGDLEPIDPVGGHIPGARNFPMTGNLASDGRFLEPEALRQRFHGLGEASDVISSCGSGVTACHNLIAMEYAGLGRGRLYPGSWSQYSNSGRPIATGD